MHLTLIFGGWIILLLGMPTGAVILLLVLKTGSNYRRIVTSTPLSDRRSE